MRLRTHKGPGCRLPERAFKPMQGRRTKRSCRRARICAVGLRLPNQPNQAEDFASRDHAGDRPGGVCGKRIRGRKSFGSSSHDVRGAGAKRWHLTSGRTAGAFEIRSHIYPWITGAR